MAQDGPERDISTLTDGDYVDWAKGAGPGAGRAAFLEIVRGRFAEIVADESSTRLTFSFAVFGAPWRYEWQGPNTDIIQSSNDEAQYDAIEAAIMMARASEQDFFVTGFQRDAGGRWLGVQQGHGAEETRVYDREPIVLSLARYNDAHFSPHWFKATVRGTIHVAAAILPQRHPDLKAFATIWRLTNPSKAPMLINDSISRAHKFPPPTEFEDVVSAIEPITALVDDTADFARQQAAQYLRSVSVRYGVPDRLH